MTDEPSEKDKDATGKDTAACEAEEAAAAAEALNHQAAHLSELVEVFRLEKAVQRRVTKPSLAFVSRPRLAAA